jgi:hypothetical protein
MHLVVRQKLGCGPAPKFLEFLRELSTDAKLPVGHELRGRGQGFENPIGRLEKNRRLLALGGRAQFTLALSAFYGQKSPETKRVRRQT